MRIETAEPVETEEEVLIEDRTAGQDGLETTLTIDVQASLRKLRDAARDKGMNTLRSEDCSVHDVFT